MGGTDQSTPKNSLKTKFLTFSQFKLVNECIQFPRTAGLPRFQTQNLANPIERVGVGGKEGNTGSERLPC